VTLGLPQSGPERPVERHSAVSLAPRPCRRANQGYLRAYCACLHRRSQRHPAFIGAVSASGRRWAALSTALSRAGPSGSQAEEIKVSSRMPNGENVGRTCLQRLFRVRDAGALSFFASCRSRRPSPAGGGGVPAGSTGSPEKQRQR